MSKLQNIEEIAIVYGENLYFEQFQNEMIVIQRS